MVDDNSDATDVLVRLLRRLGHESQPVNHGLAALALMTEFDPDLVLLDLGMSGMDGYELATRLRAQSGELHIIALTGYRRDEERLRAAGFDDHLSKALRIAQAILRGLVFSTSNRPGTAATQLHSKADPVFRTQN